MSEEPTPVLPYPSPISAALLALMAWITAILVAGLALPGTGPSAAYAFGLIAGYGGIGTLAARRVAPPQAERTGLRGFSPRLWLPLLLLVPLPLLTSELNNAITVMWPPPEPDAAAAAAAAADAAEAEAAKGLLTLESLLIAAGIAPVVEEWFFRGVLLQGLVAHMGVPGAVILSSLLFAFGHGDPAGGFGGWLGVVAPRAAFGVALAVVCLRTGSVLPTMLLSAAAGTTAVLSSAYPDALPIPGFNAPGDHTPLSVLLPAALAVGLGFSLLRRHTPPPLPPPPEPDPEDDEERGFF